MRALLTVVAWLAFLVTAVAVRLAGFTRVHRRVRQWRVSPTRRPPPVEVLRDAIESAARWTIVPVQCLERAAVTTCLFRSFGYDATFVIGVRRTPFYAHAWTELNGAVLTDPVERVRELAVVERC